MAEGGEKPDDAQKTEEPTAKRLEDARKKGQVPLSREVNNWLMICAGTILVAMAADGVFANLSELMKSYIELSFNLEGTPEGVGDVLGDATIQTLGILFLPLIVLMFIAFIGPFAQIGPLLAPEKIKPELSKISIIKGFGRLFSKNSLMEFAKGIFKIAIITVVGVVIIYPYFDKLEHLIDLPFLMILDEIQMLIIQLLTGVLIVLFIIAGIDLTFQRYQHYQQMRMTKQEVKDEYKQSEGDPHVKGRLRQLRAERARQRMIQNVPEADVVITNPTHYAIALKYDPSEMEAPQCIAKGVDEVAQRIKEIAKESGVELVENKPLARALFDVIEIDQFIPPEHFKAVAEIISFVFKKRGKKLG